MGLTAGYTGTGMPLRAGFELLSVQASPGPGTFFEFKMYVCPAWE